ncbi:RELT-like protein 2 [Rhineura floridana]|uniref:RELT-like protein 2 n=1 Tax=Rhineura floridana TaxID=261503 RepID=UPI002AC83671|nr:RELT-like protein 2 [Rhineura floridana]
MSEQNSTEDGEVDPQHSIYMLFLLVLVFFAMGLGGFLICHLLKKKGYRCRTFRDELDSDNKEALSQLQDDEDEELNEDTVEKIVKCIIQNEANVEVLKEMLGDSDADLPLPVPVPSGLCPHRSSQDGGLPHHHTVHFGSAQAPCIHCSRKKRHSLHRQGRFKEGKGKMHPGETTVFSVGRFHVTHIGKKLASHESQEESLPSSKQDLGSADVNHSNEKLQWEGSQNGIVHTGGLQQGKFQQADSESEKEPKEESADEPTQGERTLNTTANSDVSMNESERKQNPKASSLQEAGLLSTGTSNTSETNYSAGPKCLGSEALEELERLEKVVDASGDEGVQRAANEVSENKGSQVLQVGSRLAASGNQINRTRSLELQEKSSVVQDPGGSV